MRRADVNMSFPFQTHGFAPDPKERLAKAVEKAGGSYIKAIKKLVKQEMKSD